jgi:hypothetical protein
MREPCLAQAGNLNLSPTDRTAPYGGHAHVVEALLQHPSVAAEAARGTFERHKHSTLRLRMSTTLEGLNSPFSRHSLKVVVHL